MRFLLGFILILTSAAAWASDRVALVVGISQYEKISQLDNTVNDARGISSTLAGIGFDVTTVIEGTSAQLRSAVEEFAFRSETADLALIYYAGHGVEVQGENFLIPVDANVKSNKDIQRQGVSLKELLASVERARKMRIVILDSCRDNPFGDILDQGLLQTTAASVQQTRGLSGGLAKPSPDRGTMVAFAAKDGARALDGTGSNSPFALALMETLPKQDLEISLMFRQIRDKVLESTQNLQEPHTYGSLSGTPFYLAGSSNRQGTIVAQTTEVAWSNIKPDDELQMATLADQGDTRSMLGLAYMRLNAEDKRYSPKQAYELLTRAASAGSAEAQFELAQLYEKGLGVPQNLPRAFELYSQAAAADFPDALNDLGFIFYQGGLGQVRDPNRALGYFERAANKRQPQAMFNYAALIDDGLIPGKGPKESAGYLYDSLRSGSEQVYDLLRERPTMFKVATRKQLQVKLQEFDFYRGTIDGDLGAGTQRAIRAAYGLSE